MKYGNRVYPENKEDIDFWKKSGNKLILKRIRNLLENILESPFEGIAKPEQLKLDLDRLSVTSYHSRNTD